MFDLSLSSPHPERFPTQSVLVGTSMINDLGLAVTSRGCVGPLQYTDEQEQQQHHTHPAKTTHFACCHMRRAAFCSNYRKWRRAHCRAGQIAGTCHGAARQNPERKAWVRHMYNTHEYTATTTLREYFLSPTATLYYQNEITDYACTHD